MTKKQSEEDETLFTSLKFNSSPSAFSKKILGDLPMPSKKSLGRLNAYIETNPIDGKRRLKEHSGGCNGKISSNILAEEMSQPSNVLVGICFLPTLPQKKKQRVK